MSGTDTGIQVSIVIPAYKRGDLLRQALQSALDQDFPADAYEIIVVDSSPDDENAMIVQALIGKADRPIRLLRKDPEGPGPSRQLGVRMARGELIAFLDSDCQATPTWLSSGLAAFDEDVGIVQGRTLPNPMQERGVLVRYVIVEAENLLYDAANIFFRRRCFEDGGTLLRDMTPQAERPTGGEDTLVAWRAKRKGWRSLFAPDALVYHEVLRVSIWQWLVDKRHYMLPWLAGEVPELRKLFFLRYFLDRTHAFLLLALMGLALTPMHWISLVLCAPYALDRLLGASNTLRGLKRIVRLLAYLPRDLLSLMMLALGSVRFRTLLL